MSDVRIAVGPSHDDSVDEAIRQGGGQPVDAAAPAGGLVWLAPHDAEDLRRAIDATGATWVQLSSAGVEATAAAGLLSPERTWTCAKGAFAEPVAEHALTLALAGLRMLPERIEARSSGRPGGISLYDQQVTILGGGGIAASLLQLLAPFRVAATVVRRTASRCRVRRGLCRRRPHGGAIGRAGGVPGAGADSGDRPHHRGAAARCYAAG